MESRVKGCLLALVFVGACSSDAPAPATPAGDGGDIMCANGGCEDAPFGGLGPGDSAGPSDVNSPPKNLLVSDPSGEFIYDLQVSAGYLYWIGGLSRIVRAPTSGGNATTLFTHPQKSKDTIQFGGMMVDETSIYFTDSGDMGPRGLYKMPLDGSTPPAVVSDGRAPYAIAGDGDDICFVDGDAIRHIKKSGGPATTIVRGVADYRTQIAVGSGFVYFAAGLESLADEVYRFPVTAIAPDPDAGVDAGVPVPEKVSPVAGRYEIFLSSHVDEGFIYWAAVDSAFRVSATTPATKVFAILGEFQAVSPVLLYAHARALYWAVDGLLYKQALENGTKTAVAGAEGVNTVAADDQYLYAANRSNILKLPQ